MFIYVFYLHAINPELMLLWLCARALLLSVTSQYGSSRDYNYTYTYIRYAPYYAFLFSLYFITNWRFVFVSMGGVRWINCDDEMTDAEGVFMLCVCIWLCYGAAGGVAGYNIDGNR